VRATYIDNDAHGLPALDWLSARAVVDEIEHPQMATGT